MIKHSQKHAIQNVFAQPISNHSSTNNITIVIAIIPDCLKSGGRDLALEEGDVAEEEGLKKKQIYPNLICKTLLSKPGP